MHAGTASETARQQDLTDALTVLRSAFESFERRIPEPVSFADRDGAVWAHRQLDSDLFRRLKAARVVSGLNGALLLMASGFHQEVAVLLRVVRDCLDEILFSIDAEDAAVTTKHHDAMFHAFFEQRLPTPGEVRSGTVKVEAFVPRRKLTAALARLLHVKDPSTCLAAQIAEGIGLDGYVHPAYRQIMELYNPVSGGFEVDGDHRPGALKPALIYFSDTVSFALAVFGVIAARDHERGVMAELLAAAEALR